MKDPRRLGPWAALACLWIAFVLNQADRQALPSVLPLIRSQFGLDTGQLGLLVSSFHWAYALFVPLAGWMADTLDRRKIVVAAIFAWSLATGLSGFSGGLVALIAFRASTGLGEACYFPSATSLIQDWHGKERSGLAISIHQSANYLGVVLAGALTGLIGQVYGWRNAFFVFAAAGLVLATLLRGRLPAADRNRSGFSQGPPLGTRLKEILSTPSFYWLVFAYIGMLLVNTSYLAWMPTLLHDRFGLSLAGAAFKAAIFHQAGAMVGILAGGRISDAWFKRTILARPLIQMIGLIFGAPFIVAIGLAGRPNEVYLALGLFGIFRGLFDSNLFPTIFLVMPRRLHGLATGLTLAMAFFGGGFGPWAIGVLAKTLGLGPALASSSLGYVAGALSLAVASVATVRRDAAKATVADKIGLLA